MKYIGMGKIVSKENSYVVVELDTKNRVGVQLASSTIKVGDVVDVYKKNDFSYLVRKLNPFENTLFTATNHPFVFKGERTENIVDFIDVGHDAEMLGQHFGVGATVFADTEKAFIGHGLSNYSIYSEKSAVSVYNDYTELKGDTLSCYKNNITVDFKIGTKKDGVKATLDKKDNIMLVSDIDDNDWPISIYASSILMMFDVYEIFSRGVNCYNSIIGISFDEIKDKACNGSGSGSGSGSGNGLCDNEYDNDFSSFDKLFKQLNISTDSLIEFKTKLVPVPDSSNGSGSGSADTLNIGSKNNMVYINSIKFCGTEYNIVSLEFETNTGEFFKLYNKIVFGGEFMELKFQSIDVDMDNINLPSIFSINNNSGSSTEITNPSLNFKFHGLTTNVSTYNLIGTDKIVLDVQGKGFTIDQYGTKGEGQGNSSSGGGGS